MRLLRTAVLALVYVPAAARAQAPELDAPRTFVLRLDYILGEGAASCPGEEMLRQELGRRLGYDPAAANAKGIPAGRVITVIARSPRGLTATYEYVDAAGVHAWTKSYPVSGTGRSACEVAISGVAVEVVAELVHLRRRTPEPPPPRPAMPPPPPPEPSPPPAASPPPAPEPVRDAPSPSALRIRGEAGAGAFAAGGIAPRLAFAGALHGGIAFIPRGEGRAAFSIALEARADLPASGAFGARHTIHAQFLGGSLLTCIHKDVAVTAPVAWSLFGCILGTAGALRGGLERADGRGAGGGVYVAAGARPGVEARFSSLVALRLQGDLEATIKPRRIVSLTSGEGWQTGSMSGNVGVAAVFFFGGANGSGSSP